MGLFDLVDVGLCQSLWIFFFFEVALMDMRQWLLVAVSVVATWWLGRFW